eukprot:COSAG02_NODE_8509_length_2543_cov_2.043372_3_plen_85_part_00
MGAYGIIQPVILIYSFCYHSLLSQGTTLQHCLPTHLGWTLFLLCNSCVGAGAGVGVSVSVGVGVGVTQSKFSERRHVANVFKID